MMAQQRPASGIEWARGFDGSIDPIPRHARRGPWPGMLGHMPAADRTTPDQIRQAGPRALSIRWRDGTESVYAVRDLRLACACAQCVDEWTGAYRLDPTSVPEDVHPKRISSVGRYAIQIAWSDGHDTGIYAFDRLRKLADAAADR